MGNEKAANVCWFCKNAFGGCSWTEIDPDTKKVRFEPVPGWTAEKTRLLSQTVHGKRRVLESYYISACPQFVRG